MDLAEIRARDFLEETAVTRRVLERIPDDKLGWRPHAKSWTAGELATHVSNLPVWGRFILEQDELDLHPPGGTPLPPPAIVQSHDELLTRWDGNVAPVADMLRGTSLERFRQPWTLKHGGATLLQLPRAGAFDAFVMRHQAHHRGQLTVYLRLLDVPVPQVYGPTADEP
ncbi:MAG: DinB family protein [Gemmatimonadota bacterium]